MIETYNMNKDKQKCLDSVLRRDSNNLDLIRLAAAILVIWNHSFVLSARGGVDWSIQGLSVPIFGFISGLVITNSILSKKRPFDFLISISFRLFIPLALVLLVTVFFIAPNFSSLGYEQFVLKHWKDLFLYFKNNITLNIQYFIPTVFEGNRFKGSVNGSLWCLPYFFGGYLTVLALYIFGLVRDRIYSGILIALLALIFLVFGLKGHFFEMPTNHVYLVYSILIGVCVSCLKSIYPLNYRIVLACFLLYLIACRYGNEIRYSFKLLLFFSIVIWLSYQKFFLVLKPTVNISLGVFLLSFPIQQVWAIVFANSWPWLNFILTVVTVCPLAYISAKTIEKYCYMQSSKIKRLLSNIQQ